MERVSLTRCVYSESDEEIAQATQRAIEDIGDYGAGLRNARRVAIKINAGIHRVVLTDGRQTELTEPAVVEGAIRAIRNVTDAEIIIGDAPTDGGAEALYGELGYAARLAKYRNVRLLDFNTSELVSVPMAHPDALMSSYLLPKELAEADAFVSLAKMKAHAGMGCTLCIKNLFGWIPPSIYGRPRTYLHDGLIRLARSIVDLAVHMRPCLNVVDGIIAANKSEWHGTPMRPGVILAGTNIVATDSVGARVMGFDPEGDYPSHPFHYRRNAILLASQQGLGPTEESEIEVVGLDPRDICIPFQVERYQGETHRDEQLRLGARCVARYREQQERLAKRYAGRYLALTDGEVVWDAEDFISMQCIERESGRNWQDAPQFTVLCRQPEEEVERFDWYQVEADRLQPTNT